MIGLITYLERQITMTKKEIILLFKKKIDEKEWSFEDAKAIALCAECEESTKLFGDKFNSYEYVIEAMDKYSDATLFLHDFCKIIIPDEIT